MSSSRRILFVHAHPDDESIETGATMARYAAEGAHVCLVTCTLGEEGEVIPPELRHLTGDRLGEYREGELRRACAALGVSDLRFLGGQGRWRDSGMMGTPAGEDPRCFWRADLDEAATCLVAIVREVRPQVIVTYDANGYYGHPDHIQAHRVAWRAVEQVPVARFYATAMPLSRLVDATGGGPFTGAGSVEAFGFGVPDEQVTARVEAGGHLRAKAAAMRAHATQISLPEPAPDEPAPAYYALSNGVGLPLPAAEYYTLLAGPPGGETDLFQGVT